MTSKTCIQASVLRLGIFKPIVSPALDQFKPTKDGLLFPSIDSTWTAKQVKLKSKTLEAFWKSATRFIDVAKMVANSLAPPYVAGPHKGTLYNSSELFVGSERVRRGSANLQIKEEESQWYMDLEWGTDSLDKKTEARFVHTDGRILHFFGEVLFGYGVLGSAMIYLAINPENPTGTPAALYLREPIADGMVNDQWFLGLVESSFGDYDPKVLGRLLYKSPRKEVTFNSLRDLDEEFRGRPFKPEDFELISKNNAEQIARQMAIEKIKSETGRTYFSNDDKEVNHLLLPHTINNGPVAAIDSRDSVLYRSCLRHPWMAEPIIMKDQRVKMAAFFEEKLPE